MQDQPTIAFRAHSTSHSDADPDADHLANWIEEIGAGRLSSDAYVNYLSVYESAGASALLEGTMAGLARLTNPHSERSGRHGNRFLTGFPDTPFIRLLCQNALKLAQECKEANRVQALAAAVTLGVVSPEEKVKEAAKSLAADLSDARAQPKKLTTYVAPCPCGVK
jgi:hypothetical protein